MTLYRGMDKAALDAAYNNSAAVADSATHMAEWQRLSALRRQAMPGQLDLAYGPAPRQRIDFFAAPERGAPTLLFIHGGYWQNRAKEDFSFLAEGPLSLGMNVALAGYTLAPEARLDQIVEELRAATHWLRGELPRLGADPERLYVAGWSAGGHLTAMVLGEAGVKGGLAISGLFDLEPIRLSYLNDKLRLDPEEARRNSPLLHLPAESPPLLVTVGGAELPELQRQSQEFHAARQRHGLPGAFVPLPGRDHYTALLELARPGGLLVQALAKLIR